MHLYRERNQWNPEYVAALRRSIDVNEAAGISNPQPNPQFVWSCMTCAAFGSPRVLVSCCRTYSRSAVTAEAAGSSPVVPAILFNHFREWCGIKGGFCVVVCVITPCRTLFAQCFEGLSFRVHPNLTVVL